MQGAKPAARGGRGRGRSWGSLPYADSSQRPESGPSSRIRHPLRLRGHARWGRGTQVGSSRLRLLHGLAAAQERRAGDEGAKRTAVLPLSPAGSPEGRMQTHGGQQGHPGAKEATVVRAMRTRAAGNEAVPQGRPGPKRQGHWGTVAVICV